MDATVEALAEQLAGNVSGWETKVLQRIGARIKKIGGMSLNNAADVKRDLDELTRELAKMTDQSVPEIVDMYKAALEEAHAVDKPLFDYRGKTFVPISEDPKATATIRAFAKASANTMQNVTNTKMLRTKNAAGRVVGLQRAYTEVLDQAATAVASGATDFHSAMRESIRALGGNGISVNYGSGVTRRLDTVVRQNLMWGAKQSNQMYQRMIGEELDCDGIEIDWHANPRPSHEFMQGKQFHDGGDVEIGGVLYPDSTEAREALEEYNCYHYATPIICGVSVPRYDTEELEQLNEQNAEEYTIGETTKTGYEWSQDMRRLETEVRRQKSIREMAKAAGEPELTQQCTTRIAACMTKYDQISAATGLDKDTKRLTITRPKKGPPRRTPTPVIDKTRKATSKLRAAT